MPRLAIAGYYGFGNTGDEAILESTILALRSQIPGAEFSVLTNDPEGTRAAHGVNVVPRLSPLAVARALRESDLLVFGGGSLLQDATSLRSLLYYLSVLLSAQALGKPTMVYANGIGPVNSRAGRMATRLVLNRVSAMTLRDDDSARQVRMLGITRPRVKVTADPAFALQPAGASAARSILETEGITPGTCRLVGVSLRPWKSSPHLPEVMAAACDAIHESLGATVVLIPMQHTHDAPLAGSVQALARRPVAVLRRRCTPRELMACVGLMDAVVGMRLHSLIFAVAMAVPAAGISYDPKVEAFLNAVGCPSLGGPNEVTAASMCELVKYLLDNSAAIKYRLSASRQQLRELALENARIARSLLHKIG
ncbi:MAG: polysaccharide pyruvyl transferase CsaB [Firmicutes bacterium]|nr:polysaccharide pyruvyl transferase CsaB [Bacillota bacterium]